MGVTRMWLRAVTMLTGGMLAVVVGNQLGMATEFRNDFTVHGHDKKVVCYWGTWANYRPDGGKFTPEHIDPTLCTHLIYSFAGLDSANWTIKSLDPWMDLEENYGLAGFKKATSLKLTHPHLKVTLAIGGWNEGSAKYSTMAKDPVKRKRFVDSSVKFLQQRNFDAAYDVEKMYKYCDYVHVMCYDYHGKWDKKTGHNAPLHSRPTESPADQLLNVEYTLAYLLKRGAKPEKTVLGVPLYGRAFTLANPNSNKIGAPAKDTAFQGPYTREDGFLGYNEICVEKLNQEAPWTSVWEEHYLAPFMYRGDSWLSYDNERSITLKSQFAYDHSLAGVMTLSIDTDDFLGMCNGPKFPLLRTINHALYRREQGIYNKAGKEAGGWLAISLVMVTAFTWRAFAL